MHELSIAMSILDGVEEEVERRGGCKVLAVHLRLGPLSGVVLEALRSAYELAAEDSPLAGSRLVVEEVSVAAFCSECNAARPVVSIQDIRCSVCGTPTPQIVSGRELEVTALEICE